MWLTHIMVHPGTQRIADLSAKSWGCAPRTGAQSSAPDTIFSHYGTFGRLITVFQKWKHGLIKLNLRKLLVGVNLGITPTQIYLRWKCWKPSVSRKVSASTKQAKQMSLDSAVWASWQLLARPQSSLGAPAMEKWWIFLPISSHRMREESHTTPFHEMPTSSSWNLHGSVWSPLQDRHPSHLAYHPKTASFS